MFSKRNRLLCIECLETRLNFNWATILDAAGILTFFGTADSDELSRISAFPPPAAPMGPPTVHYWSDGPTDLAPDGYVNTLYTPDLVTEIRIMAFGGDDLIDLSHGLANIDDINRLTVWGGDGEDQITSLPEGEVVTPIPPLVSNIFLYGEGDGDTIIGGTGTELIDGGPGDDYYLDGKGGADFINGGTGKDEIHGGSGHDTLAGDDDSDYIYGDSGEDIIDGGAGDDEVWSGSGLDFIDQQWNGMPANLSLPDMKGTGGADCDLEDNRRSQISNAIGARNNEPGSLI